MAGFHMILLACFWGVCAAHRTEGSCSFEYDVVHRLTLLEQEKTAMSVRMAVLERERYEFAQRVTILEKEKDNLVDTVTSLSNQLNCTAAANGTNNGNTYVRWGKSSCSNNTGAELVYDGYVGGGHYTHDGAAANFLCLPKTPQWVENAVSTHRNYIYGTEYETHGSFLSDVNDHDAVCAVCKTRGTTSLMIPGRNECPEGWAKEYSGYLMTGYFGHSNSKEYICVDGDPEFLGSTSANDNGAVLYFVEAICGSLPCPPYATGKWVTCVVCS